MGFFFVCFGSGVVEGEEGAVVGVSQTDKIGRETQELLTNSLVNGSYRD